LVCEETIVLLVFPDGVVPVEVAEPDVADNLVAYIWVRVVSFS